MYTAEQIERACELVEEGMPLGKAVDACELTRGQFYRTLDSNPVLAERYARAKERQIEFEISQIIEIADTPCEGEKVKTLPNGDIEVTTGDMLEHRKLRIEARKWTAAKLMPKKYGDRQAIEHEGLPEQPSPEEAAARIAAILKGTKE